MDPKEAFSKAIELAGGQSELSRRINVSQQRISHWATKARNGIPGEFVLLVEEAVNGAVTRHELRPDIYPAPAEAAE